jgi:hypothetical protein
VNGSRSDPDCPPNVADVGRIPLFAAWGLLEPRLHVFLVGIMNLIHLDSGLVQSGPGSGKRGFILFDTTSEFSGIT